MKKINVLFVLLITNLSFAGNGITWPEYEKKEIPDSLNSENAVYIQNVKTIDFNTVGETSWIVFKRIKLNSNSSVDDLSKQEFYVPDGGKLGRLFGRIIKSNGTIEEIEEIDKYKTKITEKNEFGASTLTKYQVLFSNAEVGDVLDLYYEIKLDGYIYSSILYLEDEWSSMYSRITLRNYSRLDITALVVNQEEQPGVKLVDGIPTITWEKEGIGKSKEGYFNAPSPSQPCLIFNLWSPNEVLDYNAIYYFDANKYPANYSKINSLNKILLEASIITETDPVALKVQKLVKYFEEEFSWVDNLQVEPLIKLNGHFSNKNINSEVFFYYLQKLLTENNSTFYRCYSKSLLDGNFIHGAVALEQLDRRYLLFYDETNAEHFIFQPSNSGKYYYLDEIPFYCEGNQSIALNGKNVTLDELLRVQLPESGMKENTHFVKCMLNISSDTTAIMKRDDDLSGHFSYLLRGKSEKDWLTDLNICDSLIAVNSKSEIYPYGKKYKQEAEVRFELKDLNDSLSWFSLNGFLPNSFFIDDEENNELGDYVVMPFKKMESFSFYVTSESDIRLGEQFSDKLTNSVGEVSVNSVQMSDKMIKISYELKLEKRILTSKQETQSFIDLIEFWDDIADKKWLISSIN